MPAFTWLNGQVKGFGQTILSLSHSEAHGSFMLNSIGEAAKFGSPSVANRSPYFGEADWRGLGQCEYGRALTLIQTLETRDHVLQRIDPARMIV